MNNALELKNVYKNFKEFNLRDISFILPNGKIMGLIGKNGAGKTTTIKLILNMIKKENGEIKVFDKEIIENELEIKKSIGVVFDSNYFVDEWTIDEVEKSISIFYDYWDKNKFNFLLKKFNLSRKKQVKELSKGMQMKLMLACSLSYDAKLLILDEPTSGLDPISRDDLLEILNDYVKDKKHSVLFSTHITSDLDKIADYITYINDGRIIYSGNKEEFINSFKIIKGNISDLSYDLKRKIIGLREDYNKFEGLIMSDYIEDFKNLFSTPATLNDIVVYTNKEEMKNV